MCNITIRVFYVFKHSIFTSVRALNMKVFIYFTITSFLKKRIPSFSKASTLLGNECISPATVPKPHYIINVVVKEIVFTQKKKPAAPYDDVTGFYSFIMLLWSRNHRESSGQSLEPGGSEIFLARRA